MPSCRAEFYHCLFDAEIWLQQSPSLSLSLSVCVCEGVYFLIMRSTQGGNDGFSLQERIIWGNLPALRSPMVKLHSSPRCCCPRCRSTDQHGEFISSSQNKTLPPSLSSPTQRTRMETKNHSTIFGFFWWTLFRTFVRADNQKVSGISSLVLILKLLHKSSEAEEIPAFNIWMLLNAAFEFHRGW